MAEERALYGMGDDNVQVSSSMKFGLNAGKTVMEKFEYTDKGGKEGAPMEALDIVFKIGSVSKSYRIFPVTKESKFYGENNGPQVVFGDPDWAAKANEAIKELSDRVTHIMKCFVDEATLSEKLKGGFKTFKDYVGVLMNSLPKNFAEKKLDLFLQWQWKISGDNDKTYLEIPSKMKYGKWICAEVKPVGEWKEDLSDGLHYKDDAGNFHPFGRNDYYMKSAHASQQKEATAEDTMGTSTANSPAEAADSDNSGW